MPSHFNAEQRGIRGRVQRVLHFPGHALGYVRQRVPGSHQQGKSPRAAAATAGAAPGRPQRHQGPLDWIQQRFAQPRHQEAPSALCFPTSLCHRAGLAPTGQACQDLMTVGTRLWGSWWDGRALLRVKIYDFAVYMDRQQANKSQVRRKHPALHALAASPGRDKQPELDSNFFRDLRQTEDIEMSLLVRAARPLPIKMLAGEYERILRRRMANVGGDPKDPAVQMVVDAFREDTLPEDLRENGNVKKGTVLMFSRDSAGRLKGKANGHPLVEVHSSKLCQAVFDLYFGDQPVSVKAKKTLGASFLKLGQKGPYMPPQDRLVCDASSACAVAFA